ncbi:hypothetical protein [Rosenbergiella metrosideri]|uniref:hypothetical protein n=1 Tax=Rosenbergiella metrosideri TaxID=2921185 RepID=UPI001F4F7662|nr:hypothetical protein [Rosenbergiella metrosideri]
MSEIINPITYVHAAAQQVIVELIRAGICAGKTAAEAGEMVNTLYADILKGYRANNR